MTRADRFDRAAQLKGRPPRRRARLGSLAVGCTAGFLGLLSVASCFPTPYYRHVAPEDWLEQGVAPTITDVLLNSGCLATRRYIALYPPTQAIPGVRWHNVFTELGWLLWRCDVEEDAGARVWNPTAPTGKAQFVFHVPIWPVPVIWFIVVMWRKELRRHRRDTGRCTECGYDLTGNVSGICPECGTPITNPPVGDAHRPATIPRT